MSSAYRAFPRVSPQRLAAAALLGVALLGVPAALATAAEAPAAQAAATQPATAQEQAIATAQTPDFALSLSKPRWDYREAKFFKRISEYFTGRENNGYRLVLRTDPSQRDGLYFQALMSRPAAELPEGSTAVLTLTLPDSQPASIYRFSLPHEGDAAGKTQLWLGLTGANTPADEAAPLAWQLRIDAPSGQILAETHSFLWSPRDAKSAVPAQ